MKQKLRLILTSVFTLFTLTMFAQQVNVKGKVTDESGAALYGVNVTVTGTTTGTITDDKGEYSINVNKGTDLTYSYIGFLTQNIKVGNSTTINVTLAEDATVLGEVVVTSFGIEKNKKALGYSVTQVSGDKFTDSRTTNLGNALSGKVAGVNVSTPATGAAGSSRVVIRGGSSLGGSDQPLYVVNGIPIDNSNQGQAGMWGGNDGGDGLSSLNPDDIESLSVLKGNSAAALYGARAANGVILITTKSGKGTQGLGVSYNSNFTVDRAVDLTDWQKEYGTGEDGVAPANAEQALDLGNNSWGARLGSGNATQFDGVDRPYTNLGEGINDFYRTGSTWTNTIALTGGSETANFRFSASDLNNEDLIPNSGFNRRVFNGNMNGTFGKLVLQVSGQYSKERATNRPRLSDSPGNANFTVLMKPANISFEDMRGDPNKLGAREDGTELQHQGNVFATNPFWAAHQFSRFDVRDRFFGNASLTYNVTDWLYVRGRVGTDFTSIDAESYTPYGTAFSPQGDFNQTFRQVREDNADLFIGVNKEFDDISIDALVGGNRLRRSNESLSGGGSGLNIPFFHSVTNVRNQSYGYGLSEFGINSIFGSANIGFRNFLFLNLSGRQDQFSTLAPELNSVFYPGANVSFAFTDVIDLPSFVTFGKLRAGWAQVGGGAPNPYALNVNYGLVGQGHQGAVLGNIRNGSIPNQGLTPFLSTEFEIGLDMRFLKNRLGFDFAYYNRTTTDDILNTGISGTSGFGSTAVNIGELTNNGIELLINATPIQNANFQWDLSLNMANNISEVLSLGVNSTGEPIEFINLGEARTRQEQIRHYVGEQLGVIAGWTHREINGQKVYNQNGFPVRGDFEQLALGRHPFSAGLNNSLRYKNFNLSFLIDMRSGGSLMSGTNVLAYGFGVHKETLVGRESGLTISGVNEDGEAQTWNIAPEDVDNYYGEYNNITENFIYDASFAKLRELSFGYSIPRTFLDKTPFRTLSINVVGRNLALLWSSVPNIDPESAYSTGANSQGLEFFAMPQPRSLGFNLSATF